MERGRETNVMQEPQQVWHTLTQKEQATVFKTATRICQNLVQQWEQENSDESKPDPAC
jgi:hypothetical protein